MTMACYNVIFILQVRKLRLTILNMGLESNIKLPEANTFAYFVNCLISQEFLSVAKHMIFSQLIPMQTLFSSN